MTIDTLFEPEAPREASCADGEEHGPDGHGSRPLAARMRPRELSDFVGQAHLLSEGSALRIAVERGTAHSMILYGPPGSGKTTLARMIAERSQAAFEELSAVQAGRPEVREVLERARQRRAATGRHTILFLDEIHRFNKAQQDSLLPAVEDGLVTLVGATTENPAFEVNGALLSRVRIYALQTLSAEEVKEILQRALDAQSQEKGPEVAPQAVDFLAARTEGDARAALNALELATASSLQLGEPCVTLERAQDALQQRAILYDRAGDRHYDYISAWIKATRGSDPDASLYYLAVMLEGGEDPRFIVRRMVILASEDIGNADPAALSVAVAAAGAVEHVGLPEARYALAQAAIYLSLAPKSNAAGRALAAAADHIRQHGAASPPSWLRSGPRPGQDHDPTDPYDNPHNHPGHLSAQELLPQTLDGSGSIRFYDPDEAEAELASRLRRIREQRGLLAKDALADDNRGR
jgi:putative ATPase